MATVYEIIQGINQAAANAYDGAPDVKAGLAREEGDPILDRRVMDGFRVRFIGPILRVSYQSETLMKEVQKNGFEGDINSHLKDIVKFLKKEYKSITGNSLTLTMEGEPRVLVQRISNYRTDVQAQCDYRIGGIKEVENVKEESTEKRLDSAIEKWLSQGPKNKRPSNDTRPKGK